MASRTRQNPSKPVIGVTGSAKKLSPSWWCIRLSVFLAGGQPKRISVRHSLDRSQLHGLIISGGNDIHPSLYGDEEPTKAFYDPARDKLETETINYALQRGLPVLGICRGCQLINITGGGSLFSTIRTLRKNTSNFSTILPRKTAYIASLSRLFKVLRLVGDHAAIRINSLHHQAVDRLSLNYVATAWDKDEFIQAIESENKSIIGVQWHPEYLFYQSRQRRLFCWLVDEAAIYQTSQKLGVGLSSLNQKGQAI